MASAKEQESQIVREYHAVYQGEKSEKSVCSHRFSVAICIISVVLSKFRFCKP